MKPVGEMSPAELQEWIEIYDGMLSQIEESAIVGDIDEDLLFAAVDELTRDFKILFRLQSIRNAQGWQERF